MSRRAAIWTFAVAVLAAPPIDDWLGGYMPRLLLIEMPAWVVLGWIAGRRARTRMWPWNPLGLTGLACFAGAIGFWMIPRSVDAVRTSEAVDQLMHASLLLGGAGLAASTALLPFVLRAALGIYAASMTFALGIIYTSYRALLCGTFDLPQQRTTGHWLLVACPFVVLGVLVAGARALGRERRRMTEVVRWRAMTNP